MPRATRSWLEVCSIATPSNFTQPPVIGCTPEIARALATDPVILLLDEPAAGCNPVETRELESVIRAIAASGVTVVLVEHDMRLVMNISDRIHVLADGRTLAEGTAAQVRNDPAVIEAYLGIHGSQEAARAVG